MNAEIERTQRLFMELYQKQHDYLVSKPSAYLEELNHECDELRANPTFSVRVAVEVNRAACVVILESRKPQPDLIAS